MSFFDEYDPQFDMVRTESQARYGLSVAFIKERVGEGVTYSNEVARAVLSEAGGYCHLTEMPEEFIGALGASLTHRLIAQADAEATVRHLQALVEGVTRGTVRLRSLSLYLLYSGGSLRTRRQMFVCDYQKGEEPFTHGAIQPDVLPRFFKIRVQGEPDCAALKPLGLTYGTLFFLAPAQTDGGRFLLAKIDRTPQAVDLGALPAPATVH